MAVSALVDGLMTALLMLYFLGAVTLGLYGLNCYVMLYLFLRGRRRRGPEDRALLQRFAETQTDADLPLVTTQLPVFNEKYVVERLLRAVCAFDYPHDRHQIQVLDDSTDETRVICAAAVARLQQQGFDVQHIHRADRQGYKAGALAAAMGAARGDLIAIFDADFVPPPDFLRRTVPYLVLDERCGFVQTRWGHRNRDFSLLTVAQAIGIDGHFVVEQSARADNGLFLNFNGTAGVWRRQAIVDAGGWSADTITEDLDLSYRTQLAGWIGRFVFDAVTPAELPTDINAFKSQQHRWARGSIQTARKLLGRVLRRRDVGAFKKLQAVLHLTHYMVHPIILMMTVLALPLLLWGHRAFTPWLMVPLLGIMLVSMFAPSSLYVLSQRAAYPDWTSRLKYLPALMALGVGLAVNNTVGVLQALFSSAHGEFVRTPKLGAQAEQADPGAGLPSAPPPTEAVQAAPPTETAEAAPATAPRRGYRIDGSVLWVAEIFMGLWACAAFTQYVIRYKFLVGPLLLLHASGFLYVGLASLLHAARARRLRL